MEGIWDDPKLAKYSPKSPYYLIELFTSNIYKKYKTLEQQNNISPSQMQVLYDDLEKFIFEGIEPPERIGILKNMHIKYIYPLVFEEWRDIEEAFFGNS
uniref:Uncharacterized protein n=1 Tax=Abalone asfa-like virus TaxID=2839893 RepID=A0A5K7XX05_9VIRU|nr:hypothetical protein [Abalone asfa-like virus]